MNNQRDSMKAFTMQIAPTDEVGEKWEVQLSVRGPISSIVYTTTSQALSLKMTLSVAQLAELADRLSTETLDLKRLVRFSTSE